MSVLRNFTIFAIIFLTIEYRLRPTFDFQQEILWNGEDVEVLEPLWLRNEIIGNINRMWKKYNDERKNNDVE